MNWRVSERYKVKQTGRAQVSARLLAALFVALNLLVSAYPQTNPSPSIDIRELSIRQHQGKVDRREKLPKPKDREAFALLLHLLERFAKDTKDKSKLDSRIKEVFAKKNIKPETAARLVAKFQNIPLEEREAVFGKWANIEADMSIPPEDYRAAFERLAKSARKPKSPWTKEEDGEQDGTERTKPKKSLTTSPIKEPVTPKPALLSALSWREQSARSRASAFVPASFGRADTRGLYRLIYTGIRCIDADGDQGEGEDNPDEIYIITIVTDDNAYNEPPWNTAHVRVERHPNPFVREWYRSVQDGELARGPERTVWSDTARNLNLTVWVIERDVGDPSEIRDQVEAIATAAETACAFFDFEGCDWVEEVLADELTVYLLGFFGDEERDDSQGVAQVRITADQITQMADRRTSNSAERAQFDNREETTFPFHIITCIRKRGKGHFHVGFRINRVE